MSQLTLIGERKIPIKNMQKPWGSLSHNCHIIYNYLKSQERGRTLTQIEYALAKTGIHDFGRRLRDLDEAGWVATWKIKPEQVYYAISPGGEKE